MTTSMRGRMLRGVGAGLVGQMANVLGRLLLIPLFLHAWGVALYGEWLILTSAVALLAMSDLGGQVYYVNRLTADWARGDHDHFQETLTTGMTLFLLVPAVFALALVGLAAAVPLPGWLGLSLLDRMQAWTILLALSLQVVIALPQGLLLGIYRAIGLQATSMMMGNAILILQMILSGLALLLEAGPVLMAWLQVIPVLVVCTVAGLDIRRRIPDLSLWGVRHFSATIARESVRPSLSFLSIQLSQLSIQQGTVLLVGRILGPVEVTVFSTVRTIINSLKQVLGLLSHSAWPEFTRLEARRDGEALERLFYTVLHLSLAAAFLAIGVLDMAGERLIGLWLRGRLDYPAEVVHHFSIYVLLSIFATLTSNVLMASNRHRGLANWQIVVAAICLPSFYLGLNSQGVAGGVIGLILAEAAPACAIHSYLLAGQSIGIGTKRLVREAAAFSVAISLAWVWPAAASVAALAWLAASRTWRDPR